MNHKHTSQHAVVPTIVQVLLWVEHWVFTTSLTILAQLFRSFFSPLTALGLIFRSSLCPLLSVHFVIDSAVHNLPPPSSSNHSHAPSRRGCVSLLVQLSPSFPSCYFFWGCSVTLCTCLFFYFSFTAYPFSDSAVISLQFLALSLNAHGQHFYFFPFCSFIYSFTMKASPYSSIYATRLFLSNLFHIGAPFSFSTHYFFHL